MYMCSIISCLTCCHTDKYQSYGGQGALTTKVDSSLLGIQMLQICIHNYVYYCGFYYFELLSSATLSVAELLDKLRWHRKQLQAGTTFIS